MEMASLNAEMDHVYRTIGNVMVLKTALTEVMKLAVLQPSVSSHSVQYYCVEIEFRMFERRM